MKKVLLLDLLRWWRSSEMATNFIWNKANFAAIASATAKNLTQCHIKFGHCSRLAAAATSLFLLHALYTYAQPNFLVVEDSGYGENDRGWDLVDNSTGYTVAAVFGITNADVQMGLLRF